MLYREGSGRGVFNLRICLQLITLWWWQLLDHHNVISCGLIRSGFFGGMGGFLPQKKAPLRLDSGGAVIAPALWGFASPESTYRALLGVPPRSIEQRTQESEPPTEGRGADKARSMRALSPWLWSFFCFFSLPRPKKRRGHPRGQKEAPRGRYLRGLRPI